LHKCTRDANNHGVRLADAKMLDFNFQFSVNAGIRNRHDTSVNSIYHWTADKINREYRLLGGEPPFPSLPNVPDIDVNMGLGRFENSSEYMSFKDWADNERQLRDGETVSDDVDIAGAIEGRDEMFAEDATFDEDAAIDITKLQPDETTFTQILTGCPVQNFSSGGGAEERAGLSTPSSGTPAPPQQLPMTPGRVTAIEANRRVRQAHRNERVLMRQVTEATHLANARCMPEIEKRVETDEEIRLFIWLRPRFLNVFDNQVDYVSFTKVWNEDHVFRYPNMVQDLSSQSRYKVQGDLHVKTPQLLEEWDRKLKVVEMNRTRVLSQPGGVAAEENWFQRLPQAHLGFPHSSGTPWVTPANMGFVPAMPVNSMLVQPQPPQELYGKQPTQPKVPVTLNQVNNNRRASQQGKKHYCSYCQQHRTKETGHHRGQECPKKIKDRVDAEGLGGTSSNA
jgi:hypothetical protein